MQALRELASNLAAIGAAANTQAEALPALLDAHDAAVAALDKREKDLVAQALQLENAQKDAQVTFDSVAKQQAEFDAAKAEWEAQKVDYAEAKANADKAADAAKESLLAANDAARLNELTKQGLDAREQELDARKAKLDEREKELLAYSVKR